MTTIYDNFGATPLTLGGRVRLGRRAHVQSSERTEQQPGLCASCMRHVCVVYVSCVRHVCVMCASCMRHVCVMHASCVRHACVMCSSCVCHACAMFAPCLRRVCVMHAHVCVMCASCVRHVCAPMTCLDVPGSCVSVHLSTRRQPWTYCV